jgi:predicted dienelactone hydrolase
VSAMRKLLVSLLLLAAAGAQAGMGLTELPGRQGDGPVTVFYPSSAPDRLLERGPYKLQLAAEGAPVRGNGRLVMISHGSGGAPWTHSDLARKLVDAGFVVAFPEHLGDNWRGMSAGGHTALAMAGGRWSPSQMRRHCEAHLDDDFPSCVGLATRLRGNFMDGVKKAIAIRMIRFRLDDANWYTHDDPRVKAVVAEVPYAVDFDMASLARPRVPLGIVQNGKDKWLAPAYHSGAVLRACSGCELVADLPTAGHGSLLSPPPPFDRLPEIAVDLLGDPPGFDRALVPATQDRIVAFFRRHLLP